jgi:hypothetical protein
LGIQSAKNLGDILYAFRFRKPLPKVIIDTAPIGLEWIIELNSTGNYCSKGESLGTYLRVHSIG